MAIRYSTRLIVVFALAVATGCSSPSAPTPTPPPPVTPDYCGLVGSLPCQTPPPTCTDPKAANYNQQGTCVYPAVVTPPAPTQTPAPTPDPTPTPNPAPTPAMSYGVSLSASPDTVHFLGTSTLAAKVFQNGGAPSPTGFNWDCGDGSPITTNASATHDCTYATVGTFASTVTVTGGIVLGNGVATVIVQPAVPVVTVSCPLMGFTVTCSATATLYGSAVSITSIGSWHYGDGVSDATGVHTYVASATYTVTASTVVVPNESSAGTGSVRVIVP